MDGNYFVIHKRVLPEVYEKVLNAKKLIKEGKVKEVTEATKMAGISRSVYYKYKDYFMSFLETPQGRKATFNIMIIDGRGILSKILNFILVKGEIYLLLTKVYLLMGMHISYKL